MPNDTLIWIILLGTTPRVYPHLPDIYNQISQAFSLHIWILQAIKYRRCMGMASEQGYNTYLSFPGELQMGESRRL